MENYLKETFNLDQEIIEKKTSTNDDQFLKI